MGELDKSSFGSVLGITLCLRGFEGDGDKSRQVFGEGLLRTGPEKCGRIWRGIKGQRRVSSRCKKIQHVLIYIMMVRIQ